tara:strand:- start:179 stop:523 length:345 start_codon:yes stop_codon:yes gene_type:complete
MAFVLDDKSSYKWPVRVEIPTDLGKHTVQTFHGEFKRVTQTRIKEIGEQIAKNTITEIELISEIMVGWDSVNDDDGNPLKFTKANLKKLLDVPMVAGAIAKAFFDSIAGAKRKN